VLTDYPLVHRVLSWTSGLIVDKTEYPASLWRREEDVRRFDQNQCENVRILYSSVSYDAWYVIYETETCFSIVLVIFMHRLTSLQTSVSGKHMQQRCSADTEGRRRCCYKLLRDVRIKQYISKKKTL
jgi:hypothetical protein